MVKLAAHRAQASLDIAKTLAVSQLSEGHRQILVAARETSLVGIAAVAGHTFLELVGGQMIHQLSENSLADIHPSLSAIAPGLGGGASHPPFQPEKVEIEKTKVAPRSLIQSWLANRRRI